MSAADSLQSKLSEAGYADLEISDLINYSLVSALPAMPKAMLRMHNEIIASLKPGLGWTFSRSVCTRLRIACGSMDASWTHGTGLQTAPSPRHHCLPCSLKGRWTHSVSTTQSVPTHRWHQMTRKQRNDYVDRRSSERALREAGLPTHHLMRCISLVSNPRIE